MATSCQIDAAQATRKLRRLIAQESGCGHRRPVYDARCRSPTIFQDRVMDQTRTLTGICILALLLVPPATSSPSAAEVKTSKERLSNKAADEQRVDNCRVPVDRRGAVPRPDCAGEPHSLPSAEPGKAGDNDHGERNRGGFR
jgi:hypothetical protein